MKKIILSLIMLCCMIATWAGTGDGSKAHPYSGEWEAKDLAQYLKKGDRLAFNCVITNANINVFDTKIGDDVVIQLSSWAVGDLIGDSYDYLYSDYCRYTPIDERKQSTFIVTHFAVTYNGPDNPEIGIEGYYSGNYDTGNGSEENPYRSVWKAEDLRRRLKVGDYLAYNCEVQGGFMVFVTDTKLDKEFVNVKGNWSVADPIDDTPWDEYSIYGKYNTLEERKESKFLITGFYEQYNNDETTLAIKGYYTGNYWGDGSSSKPYCGVWDATELLKVLKKGDHLAYNCVINNAVISAYDSKLDGDIVSQLSSWAVGDPIGDSPYDLYSTYCGYTPIEERKQSTFIVTGISSDGTSTPYISIEGYYSGSYDQGDGSEENPYRSVWRVDDLKKKLKVGDYLAYNCEIQDGFIIGVSDTKLGKVIVNGKESWSVADPIDDTPWAQYTGYCKSNTPDERVLTKFLVTGINDFYKDDEATIVFEGYYTGNYNSGDGSSSKPYVGVWEAAELTKVLKEGDCLSYDCVIKDGNLSLFDTTRDMTVMTNATSWAVADPIDETPWNQYAEYCMVNPLEERQEKMFVISGVEIIDEETANPKTLIKGCYEGEYYREGSWHKPYSGKWDPNDLVKVLKVGDFIGYDCVLSDGTITVTDISFNKEIVHGWKEFAIADPIDTTPWDLYKSFCKHKTPEQLKQARFRVTKIIDMGNEGKGYINFEGYYTIIFYDGDDMPASPENVVIDSIGKICVRDAAGLMKAIKEHGKDSTAVIQIMNDIDMKDYDTPTEIISGVEFHAQLCGYYKMKDDNGNIIKDKKGDDRLYKFKLVRLSDPLFGDCKEAKIKGITLYNANKSGEATYRPHLICDEARDTEFTDIDIVACNYDDKFIFTIIPFGIGAVVSMIMGNYAGQVANEMYNCQVTGVNVIGSTLFAPMAGVGNIAGYAERTTFRNCFADALSSIYADVETNAYVGGIAGECTDCKFYDCTNLSIVSGSEKSDNVGGIVGDCTNCEFENCYNGGLLAQMPRVNWANAMYYKNSNINSTIRGIFSMHQSFTDHGECVKNSELACNNFCNNTSDELLQKEWESALSSQTISEFKICMNTFFLVIDLYCKIKEFIIYENAPDEMGGIASRAFGCTFDHCMNAGRLYCLDAYAGGIVGRARKNNGKGTVVKNCINIGYVQADEESGGIVGYLESGHIENCLNAGTVDVNDKKYAGPIYGKSDVSSPVSRCFALTHDADDHTTDFTGGTGVTNVSIRDIKSGLMAYVLNQNSGNKDYFMQDVGAQPYPTIIESKRVTESDIRSDVEAVYKVSDVAEFSSAMNNQFANIELMNDIDFDDAFFTVYRTSTPFRGSIDGKGKSLKHMFFDNGNSDSKEEDCFALIGAADNATFKNLSLDECNLKFLSSVGGFVGLSNHCRYENIKLTGNTKIQGNAEVGGLVWTSKNDVFVNCGVAHGNVIADAVPAGKTVSEVGGIAYNAIGSKFTDCYNKGTVKGTLGVIGGIVAYCENCDFTHCVNGSYGLVNIEYSLSDYGAGIAAKAKKSNFYKCANFGTIRAEDKYAAGIVGYGDAVTVNSCLNSNYSHELVFDDDDETSATIIGKAVNNSLVANCADVGGSQYPIVGSWSDMNTASGNNYRLGNSTGGSSNDWEMWAAKSDFCNGRVCYWLNHGWYNNDNAWYQTADGVNLDSVGAPVTHSDIFNGNKNYVFKITEAGDLKYFADRVNDGNQFACAVMMNDIDMSEIKDFTPIGKNEGAKQFRGMFDGRGHTITNLKVESSQAVGLFGAVHAHADIRNVIIGDGCKFTSTGDEGAGGIVGRVHIGWEWGDVHIENCGNHAEINANQNGGGILGRVSTGESGAPNVKVIVNNCFSTGTVSAREGNSALLCGYTKDHGYVTNCWSSGKLRCTPGLGYYVKPFSTENSNNNEGEFFVGYNGDKLNIKNCYVINMEDNVESYDKATLQRGVTNYTLANMESGKLAYNLNGRTNDTTYGLVWQQNLGTNAHPVFGSEGVYHSRDVKSEYGTVCLPYAVQSNETIRYYTFSEEYNGDDEVLLMFDYADGKIPAGTPLLFRVRNLGENSFNNVAADSNDWADEPISKDNNDSWDSWNFLGTFYKREFSTNAFDKYYVSDGVIKNAKQTTVPAFRAYFRGPDIKKLTNSTSGARVRIVVEDEDGETTAISLINENYNENENFGGKTYSLMGTEVGEGYRGVVIRNGKKVLRK